MMGFILRTSNTVLKMVNWLVGNGKLKYTLQVTDYSGKTILTVQ